MIGPAMNKKGSNLEPFLPTKRKPVTTVKLEKVPIWNLFYARFFLSLSLTYMLIMYIYLCVL
jgi:hypothetical protein